MNTASTAFVSLALALTSLHRVEAAQVDLAHNSVKAGTTPARPGSTLAPGSSLATGTKSKTQVSLGTNGSLVRTGSKTEAVLQSETDLSLGQGVMLASSGRRAFGREPVAVETPETKSTVKGTMLVAYQPKVYIKVTCIEGQVTVKLKALMGEFVTLQAGRMVIINPAEKRLPEEVEVDLDQLTRTCALLGPDFPALGAASRLTHAVDRQARGLDQGEAVRTPLILTGAGLEVTLQNERGIEPRRQLPTTEIPPEPKLEKPPHPPSSSSTPPPDLPPPDTSPEYIIDETTQFNPSSYTLQTPGFPLKQGTLGSLKPTTWDFPNNDPLRTPELLIRGMVDLPSTARSGDIFLADGDLHVGESGVTHVGLNGELSLGGSNAVTIDSSEIVTAAGASSGLTLQSGRSIDISNSVITQGSHVSATAPTIRVDRSKLTAGSGALRLSASGTGNGISVTNSSELLSLATTAGIALLTEGLPIAIRDSKINGRDVLIDSTGASGTAAGLVEIRNSIVNADTIRARAFNSGDRDALVISGSTFNASSMVAFYAEGASKLRFQGNVNVDLHTSDGGRAIFAGKTVEVDSGGAVNVIGNLQVYRDVDNYNKAGFGNINATGQQSHQPFAARPGF